MEKIKNALKGLFVAAAMLVATATQFNIIALITVATGWRPPHWVGVAIAALWLIAEIAALVGTFGVSLPTSVLRACAVIKVAGR